MALNLVRALDINPIEGLPADLQAKTMVNPNDPSAVAPTEADLKIVEAHMKKKAAEAKHVILSILEDTPQAIHTLEASTGLTPIMVAAQTGHLEHMEILLKAMRAWKVKRELEEWAKEDAAAAAGGLDSPSTPSFPAPSSPLANVSSSPTRQYKYAFKNPTVNRHDASGYAPIHHVIYSGNNRALAMLLGDVETAFVEEEGEETKSAAKEQQDGGESGGCDSSTSSPSSSFPASGVQSPLSVGCDVNLSTVYVPSMKPTGETPLHLAVRLAAVVEEREEESGAANPSSSSPSSENAEKKTHQKPKADLTMIKLLLKYGAMASLNARDDKGRTPLGQLLVDKDGKKYQSEGDAIVAAFLESLGATR